VSDPIASAFYKIKLRNVAHPPPRPQVVNNRTTYNNSGQVAAMGPGATATGNTLIGTAQQWNGIDRDQLAAELAKLRGALAADAAEDEDAASELGHAGEATKALKAGDESGFMTAAKTFGAKVWKHGSSLALTVLDHYLRVRLGLPPPGGE
jgi:hypothetical protein